MTANATGTLWLVVGPSGAGKDSLMDGARARLGGSAHHVFVRRDITRPAEAGGEDHNPVSLAVFEARQAAGAYALSWGAHGLFYGVPVAMEEDLRRGAQVIVNVSRSVIDEARGKYATKYTTLRIVEITVPPAVLEARLRARGRESAGDIRRRLARAEAFTLEGPDIRRFVNDQPLEASIEAFTALFRES